MNGALEVLDAPMAMVTDLGRVRGPRCGLPVNGALDQYAARVANILVGNPDGAPLLEVTAFDARFRLTCDALIAVTGADAEILVGEDPRPQWEPLTVRAGQTVSLRGIAGGVRCYLAVHGSFEVPSLLGSCAPDQGIGFGGALGASDSVPLGLRGSAPISEYWGHSLYNLQVLRPHLGDVATVDVVDGPDIEEFSGTADRLFAAPYTVTERSNHVGLRLAGGELPERITSEEKISRGVPIGALEVPPGDELLVLHRGRGVTAGYPVLGVIASTSLDTLGQVRPGQQVELRSIDVDQATRNARAWSAELAALRGRVQMAFSSLGLGARGRWSQTVGASDTDEPTTRRNAPHAV